MEGNWEKEDKKKEDFLPYEFIDHTADIGLVVYGSDLPEIFSHAARGMFDIIVDLEGVKERRQYSLKIKANDLEELLVVFLNELLYRYEVEGFIAKRVKVREVNGTHLVAVIYGEPRRIDQHRIKTEIKNATYHQLAIRKINQRWKAQVIFDV